MAEVQPLQIVVDTEVEVPLEGTSRKVVNALRRHLRQHEEDPTSSTDDHSSNAPLCLLETRGGRHRMPQGLLPKLTETCRRQGVPYTVIDRRVMVSCPALRSNLRLTAQEEKETVRRLLLHDCGVVVVPTPAKRLMVSAELISRRQQRTLVVTETALQAATWINDLQRILGVAAPQVGPLKEATPESKVVIGTYDTVLRRLPHPLRNAFGMVVFDDVDKVPPLVLMKSLRSINAHYLMGLAESPQRQDGLHGPIFMALGGVVCHIKASSSQTVLKLTCHHQPTSFDFPYTGRHQYQALVAALAQDQDRARLVATDIEAEVNAGHPCLVLSERRDHLETLAATLSSHIPVETVTSSVRPADRHRIISRFEEGALMVLLCTGQIATEAITTTSVRRLFLTFPFSYARKLDKAMESLLGPAPGKEDALLFDYDDICVAPLHRAFEKRCVFLSRIARNSAEEASRWTQLALPLGSMQKQLGQR